MANKSTNWLSVGCTIRQFDKTGARQDKPDRPPQRKLAVTEKSENALFGDDGAGYVMTLDGDAFADEIADVVYGYLVLTELED